MNTKLKNWFSKAKTFVQHNWKKAITFIVLVAAVAAYFILGELYQYLALNVWPSVK